MFLQAREVSPLKRSSKVTLLVTVRDGLMAHRAGYLLVIVIVIAIILFIAVIALTTGCLVWRMKYKSQVHSVVMQEMSQGKRSTFIKGSTPIVIKSVPGVAEGLACLFFFLSVRFWLVMAYEYSICSAANWASCRSYWLCVLP